jgi:hypothetical protein
MRGTADLGMNDKDELKVPAFGDLRHFRHDIAHRRAIASRDNSGKAEVFGDWITVGETIAIGENQIVSFMDELGLVEWGGQDTADEMLGLMKMADSERKRLGVEKIVMRRPEGGSSAARPDVAQCLRCRQRFLRTGASNCPHCGATLPES